MAENLHAGSVPDGQHPWRCLFNTDAFYRLRDASAWHHTLTDGDGNVLGDLTYHVGEQVSGWRAPYGGPDWRREYWRPEQVHAALQGSSYDGITVKMRPATYGENEAAALTAMIATGWAVAEVELSYSIAVPGSIDDYEASVARQVRAGIDRGEEAGLSILEVDPRDEMLWGAGHLVLAANRSAKGRPMSIDVGYMRDIRDAFPGFVRLYLGVIRNEIVAAALVYRIGAGRDYVQSWGDRPDHRLAFSPMHLLVREVVQGSIRTGARRLDLGSSSEDGEPNGGLCRFKRSVGGVAEPRFVLCR